MCSFSNELLQLLFLEERYSNLWTVTPVVFQPQTKFKILWNLQDEQWKLDYESWRARFYFTRSTIYHVTLAGYVLPYGNHMDKDCLEKVTQQLSLGNYHETMNNVTAIEVVTKPDLCFFVSFGLIILIIINKNKNWNVISKESWRNAAKIPWTPNNVKRCNFPEACQTFAIIAMSNKIESKSSKWSHPSI